MQTVPTTPRNFSIPHFPFYPSALWNNILSSPVIIPLYHISLPSHYQPTILSTVNRVLRIQTRPHLQRTLHLQTTRHASNHFFKRHPPSRLKTQLTRTQRVSTMPSSLPPQSSRLKRPRSNSQSTSASSSSPKRAASESEDPTELKPGFLGHNMDVTNGNTLPGSPLRETDGGNGGELAQRTDDVHLNEVEDQGNEKYKQLYNDVLGMSLS